MELPKDVAEWPYWHVEKSGKGRVIAHRMAGPWIVDEEEVFPELGGIKQRVQIGEFTDFGRGLVIDGMSQLAEAIEPIYTSALIFPAALSAGSRKRWLIAGGGDGAAPREALSFHDTEQVKLVDLSKIVIRETQRLIPSFWAGCQKDPRLEIIPRDVFAVMREFIASGERFDLVISDLTDAEDEAYTPFGASTADHLYTEEGLRLFQQCLSPDGVFAMQAQELSLIRSDGHLRLRRMLEKIYRHVGSYRIFIEFFGYWQGFLVASNSSQSWSPFPWRSEVFSYTYQGDGTSYYDSLVHAQLFSLLPKLYWRLVN